MPMSDGRTSLKKIAFEIGGKMFRFAINPENYVHSKPHRTTAVKTKSRIVIEDFQEDIPTISIKGTTGFNPTGRGADRGIIKIKEMKLFLENYAASGGNGETPPDDFYFHNFTNNESYVVHLSTEGVNYTQDANSPLLFRYEITLTVLRKAGEPSPDSIVDPEIGNRLPSIPEGSGRPKNPFLEGILGSGSSSNSSNNNSNNSWWVEAGKDIGGSIINNVIPRLPNPINPQASSSMSYNLGTSALGHLIGYYGRRN